MVRAPATGSMSKPAVAPKPLSASSAASSSPTYTGIAKCRASGATPPKWSKWPCVTSTAAGAKPSSVKAAMMTPASSPGSMTRPV